MRKPIEWGSLLTAVAALAAGPAATATQSGGCCGAPGTQKCCCPADTPCCNDAECCEAVCAVDPFCCDVAWDSLCVGEGNDVCGDLCSGPRCATPCGPDNPCPRGQICQNGLCIFPRPPNGCEEATGLNVPFGGSTSIVGTNINATNDSAPACPGGLPQVGPGVWYSVLGNGHTMTAMTCGGITNFDTMLTVLCGDCPQGIDGSCCIPSGEPGCDDPECQAIVCAADPFCCDVAWDSICAGEAQDLCGHLCGGGGSGGPLCVVGNDDFCGLQSQVQWCAKAGSKYLILVHGFAGAVGNFTLTVSDDNVNCTPAVDCPLTCFQVISESTICQGANGAFNYHVVGLNSCTGSPITFDFVGEGGQEGQPMCFTVSLYDNNGAPCCTATLCTTVPDCTPSGLPCDLDGDQVIGVTDMLILLAGWANNPGGPPDYDGDGTVGVADFLYLLANWGPCT